MNRITGLDDHAVAASLFKVFPNQVTPEMIARCKTITFMFPHEQPVVLVTDGPVTPTFEYWPDCPNCKQSATGRYYHGIHGCTRCGWSAGGNKNKRGGLFD